MNIIQLLVFSSIVCLLFGIAYSRRKKQSKDREDLEDGYDVQIPKLVTYNKYKAYLPHDDLEFWESLPRHKKRDALARQEKMVKEGKFIPVFCPIDHVEKLITREEAIEKGVIRG